jgi:hypothetical protein
MFKHRHKTQQKTNNANSNTNEIICALPEELAYPTSYASSIVSAEKNICSDSMFENKRSQVYFETMSTSS